MNFKEFLNQKKNRIENEQSLNEAFSTNKIDKVHELMLSIFQKKISSKVLPWDWLNTTIDGQEMKSYYFIWLDKNPKVWSLNYLINSKSSEVYSISFFNEETSRKFLFGNENNYKATLNINTLGTSVAYFIPIICSIVKNGNYTINKTEAKKLGSEIFNENTNLEYYTYSYGCVNYKVFENLSQSDILELFNINEASEAQEYRWKKRDEKQEAQLKYIQTRSEEDKKRYEKLEQEYKEIVHAVKGGATTIEELKMAISRNSQVVINVPASDIKAQAKLDQVINKDPEQAFKEMAGYVKLVIKGLHPGCILCGAPGIGKTFRVEEQLYAAGYRDGHNLEIIKGKCSPRQLYIYLHNNKEKGKILLIDDADSLIGPKAPEDCINMLKAALDSTGTDQGRKVVYKVSGNIVDDEGDIIPKVTYYNGGVIVITNYSAGQIDSAFKGRTFIQSLNFTTEQLLDIIKTLLPNIGKNISLSDSAKNKALDYLRELSEDGSEMEISIRTFTTCAKLFALADGDSEFDDDDAKSMIKEQMRNQYMRGGKKY